MHKIDNTSHGPSCHDLEEIVRKYLNEGIKEDVESSYGSVCRLMRLKKASSIYLENTMHFTVLIKRME